MNGSFEERDERDRQDKVDEAGEESFPASDSPCWTGGYSDDNHYADRDVRTDSRPAE